MINEEQQTVLSNQGKKEGGEKDRGKIFGGRIDELGCQMTPAIVFMCAISHMFGDKG